FARWFRQEPLSGFISDLLLSGRAKTRGLFNVSQLDRWLQQNRAARFDNLADYARANRLYSQRCWSSGTGASSMETAPPATEIFLAAGNSPHPCRGTRGGARCPEGRPTMPSIQHLPM